MKTFKSAALFAQHLSELATVEEAALQKGLTQVAKAIAKTARAEIGHYQPEVGMFPAWKELADSTKEDRVHLGFSENEPLLRTGALRNSISYTVGRLEAVIGSTSDTMIVHELGTAKVPPRPVLGSAAFRNKRKIEQLIGFAAVSGLLRQQPIHPALHYDFTIGVNDV